jgi:sugar phosphate isomerase/epimerase
MNNSADLMLGIVQGRLIQSPEDCLQWFPQEYWESEFFLATVLGYQYIELIAETQHNKNNPIWTDEGIKKIIYLCKTNKLILHAFCNDFIVANSLLNGGHVLQQNYDLISRGKLLGIKKLVLPFFEESELNSSNFSNYKNILRDIGDASFEAGMLVCIETILDGKSLVKFLDMVNHPNVKCVFDTGNRIAFGHDIYTDIELLGDKIAHIHIKDKNNKNENVLLGTGDVNFEKVFASLKKISYAGPYTFETFRGHNPLKTAEYNKKFVEFFYQNINYEDK